MQCTGMYQLCDRKSQRSYIFQICRCSCEITSGNETKIRAKTNEANQNIKKIEESLKSFDNSVESVIKAITDEGSMIKCMVDKAVAQMITLVKEQSKKEKDKLMNMLSSAKSVLVAGQALDRKRNELDKTRQDESLVQKINNLKEEISKLTIKSLPEFPNISFKRKSVAEDDIRQLIGTYNISNGAPVLEKEEQRHERSYICSNCGCGKSYSVINTHKSAISQTLSLCDNEMISCSTVISRFMKGIYVNNPPKPKYTFTWDVSIVLRFLKTFWPLEELSLKNLTLKLVALLALSTAQRVQTLNCLKLSLLTDFGDYVVFTIDELTKTSKPARWLKEVLKLLGINTGIFSAHSYRGASTSCAFSSGVSLKDILTTANWTNANTFYKFYNRDLQCSFSNEVLSTMD
ncbi:uncharacterized protein LOC134689942 [Mytilus trossulus]|uniref:uncharacterized protein LOC134689942 n=1 Tax=Mytilus trossulus TaxID=6551 RepID=UPI003007B087